MSCTKRRKRRGEMRKWARIDGKEKGRACGGYQEKEDEKVEEEEVWRNTMCRQYPDPLLLPHTCQEF